MGSCLVGLRVRAHAMRRCIEHRFRAEPNRGSPLRRCYGQGRIGLGESVWAEAPFGTVYGGVARGVVNQAVAIKLLKYGARSERAKNADVEARRYVTLPSHPHIVKSLTSSFFGGRVSHLRLAWFSSASTQSSGSS